MRNCLTSGCPPYSPSEPSDAHHPVHRHDDRERRRRARGADGARRARAAREDRDLAVARRLAVRDVAHGLERGAGEAADEAPVEREVELAAVAGEVLVELRGGVGRGIRLVVLGQSSRAGARSRSSSASTAPWTGWRVTMPSAVVTMRMSPIGRRVEVEAGRRLRGSCDHPGARRAPHPSRGARSVERRRPRAGLGRNG